MERTVGYPRRPSWGRCEPEVARVRHAAAGAVRGIYMVWAVMTYVSLALFFLRVFVWPSSMAAGVLLGASWTAMACAVPAAWLYQRLRRDHLRRSLMQLSRAQRADALLPAEDAAWGGCWPGIPEQIRLIAAGLFEHLEDATEVTPSGPPLECNKLVSSSFSPHETDAAYISLDDGWGSTSD